MITTKFGNEVEIIKRTGDGWASVIRVSDGAIREWHASELCGETPEDFAKLHEVLYGNVAA